MIFQNPCGQLPPERQLQQNKQINGQNRAIEPKPKEEPTDDIFGRPLRPLVPSVDRGIDCLDVQKKCDRSKDCLKNIADFRRACSIEECGKNSDHCLSVYEKVRAFNVFNCGCQGIINRDRCERFRAQFLQNRCLSFLNTQATQGGNSMRNGDGTHSGTSTRSSTATRPSEDDRDPRAPNSRRISESPTEWKGRRRQRSNCHTVLRQCMSRSRCLRYLIALSENCRSTKSQTPRHMCQPGSLCMDSLRKFYTNLDNIAREALTCDCVEGDPMCNHARALLRPPCAYMHSGTTCSNAFTACQKSRSCQTRYDNYQARCRPKFQCTTADRKRCLDGIATLMGTILTQRCSCHSDSFKPGDKTTCEQIKRRLEKPSCLQNGFEIKLGPHKNARKNFIDGSSVCRLPHEFYNVYTQPYVRIDRNASCSELCECRMKSISPHCTPIGRSCSAPAFQGEHSRCSQWIESQDARMNRRKNCVCVPGEARAVCLTSRDVMKLTNNPGIYVSILFSNLEKVRLASATDEVYDLKTVGRSLDNLLDTLSRRSRSRRWRLYCRLQLKRDKTDMAIYQLVNIDPERCRTRLLLLKLLAGADFPIIRHHPLLSIIHKVLVTTVKPDRDRYLPVKDDTRWARGEVGLTTSAPGGGGRTIRSCGLEISVLALWIAGLMLEICILGGNV